MNNTTYSGGGKKVTPRLCKTVTYVVEFLLWVLF